MKPISFQDQIQDNGCFGCGPHNEFGLRLKSYWDGEDSVCVFHPESHMTAGPPQFLNGGIIATLADCHGICTAVATAYRDAGRPIGTGEVLWYVTGNLNIRYTAPMPIDAPVVIRARVTEQTEKKMVVECAMSSNDIQCAVAQVVAIRVPPAWLTARS